jgi:3-isopropylmalate/(R)-2-methylmalate dehydratase small subunit
MRESARTLFLEGTWDSAATLIGAMDRVRETAARLPYLAWSPGR